MAHEIRPAAFQEVIPRVLENFRAPSIRTASGNLNSVVIINEELVVKTPRSASLSHLGALDNERQALEYTEHIDVLPFVTPRLIDYSESPAYLVATYVPGDTLTPNTIQNLPTADYERLGKDLGTFITRQIVSAEEYDGGKGAPLLKHDDWPTIFKEYLKDFSNPNYPTLSLLAHKLYERYTTWAESDTQALKVIHGDLTAENITLQEGRLHGVFDFGRFHRGEVADDLSCLASVDPQLMRICASELQSNGISVDPEYALLWRELKDLHILPYCINAVNTQHPNFRAARAQTTKRYPNLNWDELFR